MSGRSKAAVVLVGTAWVVVCVVVYLFFGRTLDREAAMYWYGFGWIFAGAVAIAPFVIYRIIGDD